MSEKRGVIGGFVAENTNNGRIDECYCSLKFNGSRMVSGGFAGENAGKIETSLCSQQTTKMDGGFCGKSSGDTERCFYVQTSGENKRDNFWDRDSAIDYNVICDEDSVRKLGFDIKNTWVASKKDRMLKFIDDKWSFDCSRQIKNDKIPIHIKNEQELRKFADAVNSGNSSHINAHVVLDNDIDLHGKEWTPIGNARANAFRGIFDGNGYTITNMLIKSDEYSKKGFFGYLLGSVYNLGIDCTIKGDGTIGSIAAINEGIIGCCGATIQCIGKGDELQVGGFVGQNLGKIFKSYAAGNVKFVLIPIVPILVLLSTAAVASAAVITVPSAMDKSNGMYNRVQQEEKQHKVKADREVNVSKEDGVENVISFTFDHDIDVDLEKGTCNINFENPSSSNNDSVVELQIKSGDSYITIGKSGSVKPGYGITDINLNDTGYENLNGGDYDGRVVLYSYNVDTGERALMNTEMPVEFKVY